MEALPGFGACAEAEAALGAALDSGGFRNAAFAVVSAAREARALRIARAYCEATRRRASAGLAATF
jgi:hypothetical protein